MQQNPLQGNASQPQADPPSMYPNMMNGIEVPQGLHFSQDMLNTIGNGTPLSSNPMTATLQINQFLLNYYIQSQIEK